MRATWECYLLPCSDAGGYDTWVHAHAAALIAALQHAIGGAPLKYVLRKLMYMNAPHAVQLLKMMLHIWSKWGLQSSAADHRF